MTELHESVSIPLAAKPYNRPVLLGSRATCLERRGSNVHKVFNCSRS